MNRTMKKIISVITTLSMCAAIIGVMPVLAVDSKFSGGSGARDDPYLISSAEDEGEATIRNLYVDFMGVGDSPGAGKKSGNLNSTNINNTFWVGVAVDKVNDLNLFTDGVYSLELAFEYNPNFVRPDIKDSSGSTIGTETEKDDRWNAKIAGVNIGSATDKIWNSNYTSIAVYDTDIDPNTDRANKDLLEERQNWKMCTVSVTLTEQDVQDLSFKGLSSPDKQYLLKLPFTLVGAPAEGASDPNPIVLSLIRGPETFDIGSGSNGEVPNAKWNETENQGALNNLKTYFNFAGDVRLFGENTSIEDITPFRMVPKLDDDGNPIEESGEIVTVEEEYKLSYDNTLSEEDFNPEVDTYYLSISNDPDNLQLRIKTDSEPYIYLNGSTTPIVTSSVTGGFVTVEIPLRELDVSTKDQDNGFNNTISIRDDPSATDSLYTIYVRRLLKPKLLLNPGNSPYGLIQQDDLTFTTQEDKDKAKQAFDSSHSTNKTYGAGMIPVGGQTALKYTTSAWDKNGINYDMIDEATFVYQAYAFTDPGLLIFDQMGEFVSINSNNLKKELRIQRMKKTGVPKYTDDEVSEELLVEVDGKYDLSGRPIRPDIYKIEYQYIYTDISNNTEKTIVAERPLIILSKRGDIDLTSTPLLNANDASALKTNWTTMKDKSTLFSFRSGDINITTTPLLNSNDASDLKSKWTKGFTEYYTILS